MKILITGKGGKSGSWQIRGVQLGAVIGATVKSMASLEDCLEADVIVGVKKIPEPLLENIRKSKKPFILDLIDGWPQPSVHSRETAKAWLNSAIANFHPDAVVYGTTAMRDTSDSLIPSIVLPHHSWQKYVDHAPVIREKVAIVGYEGDARYLGKWTRILHEECARQGWTFIINGDMRQVDIGIALRDGNCYANRLFKPNTKLSNLHALGIPAICSRESGCMEVSCGEEFWADSPKDIPAFFELLKPYAVRKSISEGMKAAQIPVDKVGKTYLDFLHGFM